MVVVGRVEVGCIEGEIECITRIRRISLRRPSVTVDARGPQMTNVDIDFPAAKTGGVEEKET